MRLRYACILVVAVLVSLSATLGAPRVGYASAAGFLLVVVLGQLEQSWRKR